MHDSVYDLTNGDARLEKLLRASLEKLAEGDNELLKEMARGVISGEMDIRQAAMSDAYGNELGTAFDRFYTGYYAELDEEQRAEVVAKTEQQLDELLDGPDS